VTLNARSAGTAAPYLALLMIFALLVGVPSRASAQAAQAGWMVTDVGRPPTRGSATVGASVGTSLGAKTISMTSHASGIAKATDQFTFAYRPIRGNATVIARLEALPNGDPLSQFGVMIRGSLVEQAEHASVLFTPATGVAFDRRTVAGRAMVHTPVASGTPPAWIKVERRHATLTASVSTDGSNWNAIGSTTMLMPETVLVGVAVASGTSLASASATFSDVVLVGNGPLDSPYQSLDVGDPSLTGGSWSDGGSVVVDGAGTGISDPSDQFRFVYATVSGDQDFVARVAAVDGRSARAGAGVMFRQNLYSQSAHAVLSVGPGNTVVFSSRTGGGVQTMEVASLPASAPVWLKLRRRGSTVTALFSKDGVAWTTVGQLGLTLSDYFRAGLVVTSGDPLRRARAVFDSVALTSNLAPTVTLTSPAASTGPAATVVVAPGRLELTATAADPDGSISRVDFYAGSRLIGSDTTSPYSYVWNDITLGTYAVTAVARDDGTASTKSAAATVTAVANVAPAVTLTAPAAGAGFAAPGTIALAATAADPDGVVVKVDYYAGSTLVASAMTSPYAATWTNAAAGIYVLRALATDNRGATRLSATRTITVKANAAPTVALTKPAAATSFVSPVSIAMTATASDVDGRVVKVDFFAGTMLVASSSAPPYAATWASPPAGTHVLTVVATDDRGVATSAARTIVVAGNTPPMVSLASPTDGASYTMPAPVVLTATASDADGGVAKVEFYDGTTLLGSRASSPYSITWRGVPEGRHAITAVAYDQQGGMTVSSTRDIVVTGAGMPTTAVFTPSADHDAVDGYLLEIFVDGSDPDVAQPIATRDLGRPVVKNHECSVDVRTLIASLPPGRYIAVVSATSHGGIFSSEPSPVFSR